MKELSVGIGESLWDMLPDGKKVGGAPANFAYHISQFGLDSLVVSAIGNDRFGDELLERFNEKGIKSLIERVPYPTGTVEIEVDEAGIPQYEIKENVAWDNIPFTERLKELAGRTRAVCFGSLAQRNVVSRNTIKSFLDSMPDDEGRLRVFDVNLRQGFFTKEILNDSMERCNVLKINDEELVMVGRLFNLPGIDLEEKCKVLSEKYGLKFLILTCGVNGSYVFSGENVSFQQTPKVDVVDTVGAGDSFTAAFIACILRGESVEEAHRKAVATSAFVCTQAGAMPVLPSELTK